MAWRNLAVPGEKVATEEETVVRCVVHARTTNAGVSLTIRKLPNQRKWRLYSHTGRNLGTFSTRTKAVKRERQVNFFKHR